MKETFLNEIKVRKWDENDEHDETKVVIDRIVYKGLEGFRRRMYV